MTIHESVKHLRSNGKLEESFRLLEQHSGRGDSEIDALLGLAYLDGLGVEADVQRGMELIENAAEAACPEAIYLMGYILCNGAYGIGVDVQRGIEYYKSAELSGHSLAAWRLAQIYYYRSKEEPETLDMAVSLYKKYSKLGDADHCVSLGDLYIMGIGVGRDPQMAKLMYEKAASIGSAVGDERLEDFLSLELELFDDR